MAQNKSKTEARICKPNTRYSISTLVGIQRPSFPKVSSLPHKKKASGETAPPPMVSPSSSVNWKERVFIPTLLAGVAGGGVGLLSKHRKNHGLANISATYATNFAIVTGCYCGAREYVRISRKSEPDDLLDSAISGFGCGALLGRLQGGQLGAIRYSIIFAIVGPMVDFAAVKLRPVFSSFQESMSKDSQKDGDWFKLPEWSPIQVLDDEAFAKKQARERELYEPRSLGNLHKEESR